MDDKCLVSCSAPRSTVLAQEEQLDAAPELCELCVGHVLTTAVSQQLGELNVL